MKKASSILIILFSVTFHCFGQQRHIIVDGTKIWINSLSLENRQKGQPVIIFENGHGVPMDNWDRVLKGVSELAPLITYDRAGIGKSESVDEIPSIENVSNRLVKMLQKLELAPPYVLVGHSLGGLYVRGFANHYPELLAGLIIIDPADFTENHQNKRAYYDVLNWEDTRVDSLIRSFIDQRNKRQENTQTPVGLEGQYLEEIRAREFKEITDNPLPNIPVHIITGGRYEKPEKLRSKVYDELALFRSKMKHRVARWTEVIQSVDKGMLLYSADAGHYVHWDDPELVIASIRLLLLDYEKIKNQH